MWVQSWAGCCWVSFTSDMQLEPFQSLCARSCPSVFHRGKGQTKEPVLSTGHSLRGVIYSKKYFIISIFIFIIFPENNFSKSNFQFFLRGRNQTRKFYPQMKLGVLCN